jgi:hypothetical protein
VSGYVEFFACVALVFMGLACLKFVHEFCAELYATIYYRALRNAIKEVHHEISERNPDSISRESALEILRKLYSREIIIRWDELLDTPANHEKKEQ